MRYLLYYPMMHFFSESYILCAQNFIFDKLAKKSNLDKELLKIFKSEINSKYSFEGKLGSYGVEKAEGEKCSRCWMLSVDVGKDGEFDTLCERCVSVIKGGNFELEG